MFSYCFRTYQLLRLIPELYTLLWGPAEALLNFDYAFAGLFIIRPKKGLKLGCRIVSSVKKNGAVERSVSDDKKKRFYEFLSSVGKKEMMCVKGLEVG